MASVTHVVTMRLLERHLPARSRRESTEGPLGVLAHQLFGLVGPRALEEPDVLRRADVA